MMETERTSDPIQRGLRPFTFINWWDVKGENIRPDTKGIKTRTLRERTLRGREHQTRYKGD